ncbi:mitochondrial inner membrane protease subunit 1 [Cylas formicarius]|uniref:mitochondrial inner membrane protease subunit 1 n=1 Tax=Cylas formicarius TaxID=197179 RepID=UPI002958DED9|nr:mitochondrial inner membrane protease subunit 1 [Cylas formicarius]
MKNFVLKCLGSLGYVLRYGCIAHCTFEYVGDFVLCSGPSMEPTIFSDDILFTEHISALTYGIKKGDIVIAKCPTNPKQQICKRVVGLSGEKMKTGFSSYERIPIGHVWLQGDNYTNSTDSRSYGPVPIGLIKGRAICKVWPPTRITMLSS